MSDDHLRPVPIPQFVEQVRTDVITCRVVDALAAMRQRDIQRLHAGISLRNWHEVEVAANSLRDVIDALLIQAGRRP